MGKDRDKAWVIFTSIAVGVVLAMVLGAGFVWWLIPQDNWSVFAEVYGAIVGTFFAGLAFAGLVLSIHLQRRELEETREELKRTADAQIDAQKALAAQVDIAQLSARLNAAVALKEVYDDEIRKVSNLIGQDEGFKDTSKFQKNYDDLQRLRNGLVHELSGLKDALQDKVYVGEGTATRPTRAASGVGEVQSRKI